MISSSSYAEPVSFRKKSGHPQEILLINERYQPFLEDIGFTGFDGGRLGQMVDIHIHVNSTIIEHVEDIHLMLEHMIVRTIKDQPFIGIDMAAASTTLPADVMGD